VVVDSLAVAVVRPGIVVIKVVEVAAIATMEVE